MSNIDMNTTDSDFNDTGNVILSIDRIETSDTISQFMEKVNNNFTNILKHGGGPRGVEGDQGHQGVPTKPKVPIHVWVKGVDYYGENEDTCEIIDLSADLTDVKYQEGHLIILENAHVYILENNSNFELTPKFIMALQSYDPGEIVHGKNAYVHFAYADSENGDEGFIVDNQLMDKKLDINTFNLTSRINAIDKPYMGIYSDRQIISSNDPSRYTWVRIQGKEGIAGIQGEQGPKGDTGEKGEPGPKGDGYTGHPYTVDLEGDMSTISIDIDRTRLYSGDNCFCKAHAYYGNDNVFLPISDVSVILPSGYSYINQTKIVDANNSPVGEIHKKQVGNDVSITFIPDENFIFPKNTILFTVHVESTINDENDGNEYEFTRDLVWMVKGIMSTFELEILPQYKAIKLFDDGQYYPEKLLVTVYKVEDAKRDVFDFSQIKNTDFTLLYKNLDDKEWIKYPDDGVDTKGVSCLEFKVVRYYGTENEEIWDYEDVWVVADGKSVHYYHADLGSSESMMILTTGEMINVGTEDEPIYCAELRNESGYSITFEPKFYDGTTELEVEDVNIGSINGEEYALVGSFERELGELIVEEVNGVKTYKSTFTITKVPYNVDMIPMTFDVRAKYPTYDNFGNIVGEEHKNDTVSFNVYISTLSNLYTLNPTVSAYNTSTGKAGDTIGCNVYKNDIHIQTSDLDKNALSLKYIVSDGGTKPKEPIEYTEPIIYVDDDDINENEFTAKDVAIEFILYYRGNEVARSTVPLIKDGIDGRDGDSWQYIFCRSPKYPFERTGISNPSTWIDNKPNDSNNELLGNNGIYGVTELDWYDDHKGVDSQNRYEYQAYRKWDKDKKCWEKYGEPTLYSNYSESGSGYSVILSNPIAVIPVGVGDNDWSVDENNKNQSDSTFVYLYNNTSDISSNQNVTISLPDDIEFSEHFKITKDENSINKVTFTPVIGTTNKSIFDFGSNAQYKLPITLTYKLGEDGDSDGYVDNFTSTINWILSPIKGLEDVEVFVDKRVVNTSVSPTHTFRVGYYLISSNGGRKFIENRNVGNTNGYQIILTEDVEEEDLLNGILVTDWQNAQYTFVRNDENINCYVVLVDSNKKIIDYTNITSINDGKSSMHLELTQDYISLPSDPATGGLHEKYDVNNNPISSKMMLYDGDTLIEDFENITYSFKVNDEDVSGYFYMHKDNNGIENGGFDISDKNLIVGDMNIECIATYKNNSFHKTLFIDLEKTPYELEINKNIITRDGDSGEITTDKLAVRVKCWVNGEWKYIGDGDVFLIDSAYPDDPIRIENIVVGDELYTRHITLSVLNIDGSEVRISYIRDNKELSYEIIGIISSGKTGDKGTSPTLIDTKILGYSLNEEISIDDPIVENDDEDDTVWKSALNYLNPQPSTGQAIYILNEYTWSNDDVTRGKTVTMAGTQGVNGKSRVLFYLGSFEDGKATLTGSSVTGYLTDDRCDYYIDFYGNAWMRKGNRESTIGTYNGNGNQESGYWEASTKVGFLKAGAITADMINTGSLVANDAFVTDLFALDVTAKNLKVDAANIIGTLNIGTGDGQVTIGDGAITADMINSTNLKVNAANITGMLSARQINATNLKVKAANITGTLSAGQINTTGLTISSGNISDGAITETKISDGAITTNKIDVNAITADKIAVGAITADKIAVGAITADKIDVGAITADKIDVGAITTDKIAVGAITADKIDATDLSVCKLNTKPDVNKSSVNIEGNGVTIYDSNGFGICDFSDDSLDINTNDAFKISSFNILKFENFSSEDQEKLGSISSIYQGGQSSYTLNRYNTTNSLNSIGILTSGKLISFDIIIESSINQENLRKIYDVIGYSSSSSTISFSIKPYIEIYNNNIKLETLKSNSLVSTAIVGGMIEDATKKIYSATLDYETTMSANYKFKVGLNIEIKAYNIPNGSPITDFKIDTTPSVKIQISDVSTSNCMTKLRKNGILINNKTNGILVGKDGIVLKYGDYGIKINSTGIHYSTNLNNDTSNLNKGNWKILYS